MANPVKRTAEIAFGTYVGKKTMDDLPYEIKTKIYRLFLAEDAATVRLIDREWKGIVDETYPLFQKRAQHLGIRSLHISQGSIPFTKLHCTLLKAYLLGIVMPDFSQTTLEDQLASTKFTRIQIPRIVNEFDDLEIEHLTEYLLHRDPLEYDPDDSVTEDDFEMALKDFSIYFSYSDSPNLALLIRTRVDLERLELDEDQVRTMFENRGFRSYIAHSGWRINELINHVEWNLIHKIAACGEIDLLEASVKSGVDFLLAQTGQPFEEADYDKFVNGVHNLTIPAGSSPHFIAIAYGHLEFAKALFKLDSRIPYDALSLACARGHLDLIQLAGRYQFYPQHIEQAAFYGRKEVIEFWVNEGHQITDEIYLEALKSGNEELIAYLQTLKEVQIPPDEFLDVLLISDNETRLSAYFESPEGIGRLKDPYFRMNCFNILISSKCCSIKMASFLIGDLTLDDSKKDSITANLDNRLEQFINDPHFVKTQENVKPFLDLIHHLNLDTSHIRIYHFLMGFMLLKNFDNPTKTLETALEDAYRNTEVAEQALDAGASWTETADSCFLYDKDFYSKKLRPELFERLSRLSHAFNAQKLENFQIETHPIEHFNRYDTIFLSFKKAIGGRHIQAIRHLLNLGAKWHPDIEGEYQRVKTSLSHRMPTDLRLRIEAIRSVFPS